MMNKPLISFFESPDHSVAKNNSDCSSSHISLENACVDIDGQRILSELCLDVEVARLGVVGRNGSGKSTFARLLAGLTKPSAGSVKVGGHDLFNDRRQALRDVGILFQNPDHQIIFPTVVEEIEFGLRQLGHERQSAQELALETLKRFGKGHWKEAATASLSQGQKHLLCLMAVVAMNPGLIVMDEPFAGLDIPTKQQLTRYLGVYKGGLVHITHDPIDIANYDKTVWLEAGSIQMYGVSAEILSTYQTEMIKIGGTDDLSDISS